MSKILILANSSIGLYDFRNELLAKLLELGHEVVVSIPDDVKKNELAEEGCRVVHTEINRRGVNPIQDLGLMRSYNALIKQERPDAVLSYTIKPNIYGGFVCKRRGVPYFSTVTGLGTAFERGGILLKLIVRMYKHSLDECRCLFFQNADNRHIFESHGIRACKHVTVSGSGVNLKKHVLQPYPGHSDDVTRFIYIGRIMKEKGMDEYLYCAEKLHEKYGDRISFAGIGYFDDDYEERIKAAEKAGYFKMIPFQKDIRPYLAETDAVVHPSYHEGMSNVIMEAAATGRPVIASDIGGCREIVDPDVSGFLVPPRDRDALYDALDRFMGLSAEERRAMGEAGRKFVEEHFDRDKVVSAYIDEINGVLKSNGR